GPGGGPPVPPQDLLPADPRDDGAQAGVGGGVGVGREQGGALVRVARARVGDRLEPAEQIGGVEGEVVPGEQAGESGRLQRGHRRDEPVTPTGAAAPEERWAGGRPASRIRTCGWRSTPKAAPPSAAGV